MEDHRKIIHSSYDGKKMTELMDKLYELRDNFLKKTIYRKCSFVDGDLTEDANEKTNPMLFLWGIICAVSIFMPVLIEKMGNWNWMSGLIVFAICPITATEAIYKVLHYFNYNYRNVPDQFYERGCKIWEDREGLNHFGRWRKQTPRDMESVREYLSESSETSHCEKEISMYLYKTLIQVSYLRSLALASRRIKELDAAEDTGVIGFDIRNEDEEWGVEVHYYEAKDGAITPEQKTEVIHFPDDMVRCLWENWVDNQILDFKKYEEEAIRNLEHSLRHIDDIAADEKDPDLKMQVKMVKEELQKLYKDYDFPIDLEKLKQEEIRLAEEKAQEKKINDLKNYLGGIQSDMVFPTEIQAQISNLQQAIEGLK